MTEYTFHVFLNDPDSNVWAQEVTATHKKDAIQKAIETCIAECRRNEIGFEGYDGPDDVNADNFEEFSCIRGGERV